MPVPTADPASRGHYTGVAIALHWTIALLIVTNLTIGLLHETLLTGALPLHKSIGLLVLALSVVRLGWRLTHRPPPLPTTIRPWEKGLAHLNHWLLYAVMILLPLSGWVFTSAGERRYPTSFFGLFPVPPIVGQDRVVNEVVAERHEQLAWIMIALLALHIVAAIKHRFVDRDRTVERMLPGAGPA